MSQHRSDLDPPADAAPIRAGKAPRGTGASPLVAQLVALALVALGVVGVQEAVVRSGLSSASSWTSVTLGHLDGRTAPPWAVPAGIGLILVGVLLVLIALKRRPRRTLPVRSATGLHIKSHDVERLVEARLDGVDGATGSDVRVSGRRVRITVTSVAASEHNDAIVDDVEQRAAQVLGALERSPRVRTRVKNVTFA